MDFRSEPSWCFRGSLVCWVLPSSGRAFVGLILLGSFSISTTSSIVGRASGALCAQIDATWSWLIIQFVSARVPLFLGTSTPLPHQKDLAEWKMRDPLNDQSAVLQGHMCKVSAQVQRRSPLQDACFIMLELSRCGESHNQMIRRPIGVCFILWIYLSIFALLFCHFSSKSNAPI